MTISLKLVDEILKDYQSLDGLLGDNGLLQQLTKALLKQALQGELTHHLGYEKHSPKNSSNSRNGSSAKTLKSKRGQLRIGSCPKIVKLLTYVFAGRLSHFALLKTLRA